MERQGAIFSPSTEFFETDQESLMITPTLLGQYADAHVRVKSATLEELVITGTRAITLDVSECPNLSMLTCDGNRLTRLTTPMSLTYLNCQHNRLSHLTINEGLRVLECSYNNLIELPLTDTLTKLICKYNALTKLKLSKNLRQVVCSHNRLRTLNANRKLRVLMCDNNLLDRLYLNRRLEHLFCGNNRLTGLRLKRESLSLMCPANPLYAIDVDTGLQIRFYWERPGDRTDDVLCKICCEPGDQLVETNCGHLFHMNCVIFLRDGLCPTCRANIPQYIRR